jgi:hypothetical protein
VDDEDRQSILSRRARFIAAALATLTATASACDGCSDVVVVDDDGAGGEGGQPQPCLSPKPPEGGGGEGGTGGVPQPCLGQTPGGGGFGGTGDGGFGGAQPCLAPRR